MAKAAAISEGDSIPHTPVSDVASGDVVVLGSFIGVARVDIIANRRGKLAVAGIFDFDKTPSAINAGDQLFWDAAAKEAVRNSAGGTNNFIGRVLDDLIIADPKARIRMSWLEGFVDPEEVVKLTASNASAGDQFGNAVSISGDTVVIGASYTDAIPSNSGSAYILERNLGGSDNWGERIEITASDAAASDFFSFDSVDIGGDTVVIGSPYQDSSKGAVYVFGRDTGGTDNWGQVEKITASDIFAGDKFGKSVSVEGDTAVVGAPYNDDNGSNSGSAYVFGRNTGGTDNWGEIKKLLASDAAVGAFFGNSVSVDGDLAVVGALYDSVSGVGAAYIFARNQGGPDNWGEVIKLAPTDSNEFGSSVSIDGNFVVVGAREVGSGGSQAAYVFGRNEGGPDNWGLVKKLVASDVGPLDDKFGNSVSISGDVVIVGAHQTDDDGVNSGSAYIFNRNKGGTDNWGEVAIITASDADTGDRFGKVVSIDGEFSIVGADRNDDAGTSSGSAYIFKV